MIWHLLEAADRYAVHRLSLVCQSILCNNLDVENVSTTLVTTGDCVVTECPDNYRVSKVGALGKQYLPSANTRKT
jgi:hypothetical protein